MNRFKLAQEPKLYQFTKHFLNLVSYFHPENSHFRMEYDKMFSYNTSEILIVFNYFLHNPLKIEQFASNPLYSIRQVYPLHFRIATLINDYGAELAKEFIDVTYKKVS